MTFNPRQTMCVGRFASCIPRTTDNLQTVVSCEICRDMVTCYICGRPLSGRDQRLKRRVKTGEWVRKNYSTGHPQSRQVHFGYRVVCSSCGQNIDRENRLQDLLNHWEIGVVLVLVLIVFLMSLLRWVMSL